MFVTRKKHQSMIDSYRRQISTLDEKVLELEIENLKLRGEKRVDEKPPVTLENTPVEFEETPVAKHSSQAAQKPVETAAPVESGLQMPPRSEYEDRIKAAMKLFRENHPRSEVERLLNVSRNTARKYLRMARDKKRISAKRYDELNK